MSDRLEEVQFAIFIKRDFGDDAVLAKNGQINQMLYALYDLNALYAQLADYVVVASEGQVFALEKLKNWVNLPYSEKVKDYLGHYKQVREIFFARDAYNRLNLSHALSRAAEKSQYQLARACLEYGADVNSIFDNMYGQNPSTALIKAAGKGDTRMVSLLIKSGANLDLLDANGVSALMVAVAGAHVLAVKQLISAGANLNISVREGNNVLTALSLVKMTRAGSDADKAEIKKLLEQALEKANLPIDRAGLSLSSTSDGDRRSGRKNKF
jgi:hypothetical protein